MNNWSWRLPSLATILWVLASLVAFGAFLYIAPNLLNPPQTNLTPTAVLQLAATALPTATVPLTPTPISVAPPVSDKTAIPLPTAPPGARIYTAIADPTRSGYLKTNDEKLHWGDRNLHAGYFGSDRYSSVLFFDISELPPNAEILSARVELTGLSRDNLGSRGEWRAELIRLKPFQDWDKLKPEDFDAASVTTSIGNALAPADLDLAHPNDLSFNGDQIPGLESDVGADTFLVVRLEGPAGPDNSLFTWDSGGLDLKTGAHPTLQIVARNGQFVVVTNTPTAENVITAAALAVRETDFATRVGTPTPFPRTHATATPIVLVTKAPTALNVETRVAVAQVATAVAITTGTFTPTPPNWVEVTETFTPIATRTPQVIPISTLYARLTPTVLPTKTPSVPELLETPVPAFLKGNLLIVTDRFNDSEVVVMRPDGTLTQGLTGNEFYTLALTREPFSPDRRQRAIVAPDSSGVLQIWIEDQATRQQSLLTHLARGISYDPVWSPDGGRIAYVSREAGSDEIFVIDLGSKNATQITHGGNPFIYKQKPTWSPDGTQIAFKANDGTLNFQIWVMNADGSELHNISQSESNDIDPVWVK